MKKSMSVLLAAAMCARYARRCGSHSSSTLQQTLPLKPLLPLLPKQADSSASAEGVNVFKIGGTSPLTGAAKNLRQRCKERRTDRR